MSIYARNIIGTNVKAIRKALGLSQLNFSIVTEISKATIVNIEAGKNGYNLNLLDKITSFTKYSLQDLSNKNFLPDRNLREKLIKTHIKNPLVCGILNTTPEIVYAINYKLLKSDFINTPKEISEIKKYFQTYEWDYKGTSISNALKRMPEKIEIQKHPSKKNTFLYSKKGKNNI